MSARNAGKLTFDFGEERHVKIIVKPVCETDLPFTIRNARYELICGGEIEAQGECTVSGHELDVFLSPTRRVYYQLRLIYEIADETWVDVIEVEVV